MEIFINLPISEPKCMIRLKTLQWGHSKNNYTTNCSNSQLQEILQPQVFLV